MKGNTRKMERNSILVYARLKPSNSKYSDFKIIKSDSSEIITFKRFVGNKKKSTSYSFRFNKIFETFTEQKDIFTYVAKPMIDRALQGYNGAIMAYGQTGSGKTYTMTGGTRMYEERGIVPRSLQYLFNCFHEAESTYTVHISYLEVYNENGYDLLTRRNGAVRLEEFPRVIILEDTNHKCHIRNLQLHSVCDEREALDLLFLGDTNRIIAETPENPCSSRSHCIFTIHLTARIPGRTKLRRSKLHFVDLAGSERASKAGLVGSILREAKSINRSLHFLERVTVALADMSTNSSTCHVPYRNSLLTNILRDSLGGNCLSTFVITLAMDDASLPETLSSCRFSQRAAMIKNIAVPNEEPDLMQEAALLRDEVERLREILARTAKSKDPIHKSEDPIHKSEDPEGFPQSHDIGHHEIENKPASYYDVLPQPVIEECKRKVENFISEENMDNNKTENILEVGSDPKYIQLCFQLLKKYFQEERKRNMEIVCQNGAEIAIYKQQIHKNEIEISKLQSQLQQEKLKSGTFRHKNESQVQSGCNETKELGQTDDKRIAFKIFIEAGAGAILQKQIEERKQILKHKFIEAQKITEDLQAKRQKIITLCQQLNKDPAIEYQDLQAQEQITQEQDVLAAIFSNERIETMLKEEQEAYGQTFGKMKDLKCEINHLNNCLKQAEIQLEMQFKYYWHEARSKWETNINQLSPEVFYSSAPNSTQSPCLPIQNPRISSLQKQCIKYNDNSFNEVQHNACDYSTFQFLQTFDKNIKSTTSSPQCMTTPQITSNHSIQVSDIPYTLPSHEFSHNTTVFSRNVVPVQIKECNPFSNAQPNNFYPTYDQASKEFQLKNIGKTEEGPPMKLITDSFKSHNLSMTKTKDFSSTHYSTIASIPELPQAISNPKISLMSKIPSHASGSIDSKNQGTSIKVIHAKFMDKRETIPLISEVNHQLKLPNNHISINENLVLTGDQEIDEDIVAFYQKRNRSKKISNLII